MAVFAAMSSLMSAKGWATAVCALRQPGFFAAASYAGVENVS